MVKKKIVTIIQCRLGSLRLPKKALLTLKKKTVLSFLINRISKSKLIDEIIVAIPKNKKNLELNQYIFVAFIIYKSIKIF